MEKIFILAIVAGAGILLIWKLVKMVKGDSSACSCSEARNCPRSKKRNNEE